MSYRNELPQSGWNLPPGVSLDDIERQQGLEYDGAFDACIFCGRVDAHDSSDCPDADESADEHLFD